MVVFVPFGLPGEEVRVRLVERKRSFARGEIVARDDGCAGTRVSRLPLLRPLWRL